MLKMYLNGNMNQAIDLTSYSRNLNVPDTNVRFDLSINFSGDYSADGIEYFANYADTLITDIEIINEADNTVCLNSTNIKAKIQSLNESCDDNGRYGYATLSIYEANATI